MNALAVVLNDLVLPPGVAHSSLLTFAMAARAELRNIDRERRGFRVLPAEHPVRAVTFLARRSIGVVSALNLSVRATQIHPADFVVALGAVHELRYCFARSQLRNIHLGMTLAARYLRGALGVPRMVEFRRIHEDRLTIPGSP